MNKASTNEQTHCRDCGTKFTLQNTRHGRGRRVYRCDLCFARIKSKVLRNGHGEDKFAAAITFKQEG